MVKFAKNGSDVTTAAVRLARAHTGRKRVAIARDNPFYSFDDWFIGTTPVDAGIPEEITSLTVSFPFGNTSALEGVFATHPADIAAVVIETGLTAPPPPREGCARCMGRRVGESSRAAECPNSTFLKAARDIATRHGAVLIFDEMLTGFRWHLPAAHVLYDVAPDLACFGKALANGFSVAALTGVRDIMELGGIRQVDRPKVFLLSATNGGETHALAAALAVIEEMQEQPVIDHLWRIGGALQTGLVEGSVRAGLADHVQVSGYPCGPALTLLGSDGRHSAELRTLFLQETVARGILMPYIAPSFSHTLHHVARTVEAAEAAFAICRRAIDEGIDRFLQGPPVRPVFRRFN
jgi:glutamate-1-semialdehyde 2,1-aminomutase